MAATLEHTTTRWRRYGIGIDASERFSEVCVMIPCRDKDVVEKYTRTVFHFPEQIADCREWLKTLLVSKGIASDPLVYAIESTATYHMPIVRVFGGAPILINPALAAQFKARKTDKWDAAQMAYQTLTGLWTTTWLPDPKTEMMRIYLRHRRKTRQHSTRCLSQIKIRMNQWGCSLVGESVDQTVVRNVVEDLADGREPVIPAEYRGLQSHRFAPRELWQLLNCLYEEAERSRQRAKELEKLARALCTPEDQALIDILQTAPGVGELTALTWMAEVEPTSRFTSAYACAAYCGFDPTPLISAGKTVKVQCRKGNKFIRSLLVQGAQSVLSRNKTPLGEWGRGKKKHWNVKATMVARRLCVGLYHMSLHRQPWSDEGYSYGKPEEGRDGDGS